MKDLLLATAIVMSSTQAYAIVQTEVHGGQRTEKVTYDTQKENGKTKSVSGTEVGASVLLDPIPAVPVAFGLTFQSATIDRKKIHEDIVADSMDDGESEYYDTTATGSASTVMYGPMVKVWIPTPYVKPYLKFAYLMGTGVEKLDVDNHTKDGVSPSIIQKYKGSQKYSQTGTDIDLGIGFSPVKFFTVFVEYGIHSGKTKVTDQTIEYEVAQDTESASGTMTKDDLTDEDKASKTANATALRLGLNFAF